MAYTVCHAPIQMTSMICFRSKYEVILTAASLGSHSIKVLSTTVGNSVVAMLTNLCRYFTYNSGGAWHTLYAMLHAPLEF